MAVLKIGEELGGSTETMATGWKCSKMELVSPLQLLSQ